MKNKQRIKLLAYNFLYAVLAIISIPLVLVIVFMFMWDTPSCGRESEAVAYARAMGPDRLEQLYKDMELYSGKDNIPLNGYDLINENEVMPKEFRDLRVIKVRPSDGSIMVQGCFDEYVFLNFKGSAWRGGERQITLSYPAHSEKPFEQKVEIIWPK